MGYRKTCNVYRTKKGSIIDYIPTKFMDNSHTHDFPCFDYIHSCDIFTINCGLWVGQSFYFTSIFISQHAPNDIYICIYIKCVLFMVKDAVCIRLSYTPHNRYFCDISSHLWCNHNSHGICAGLEDICLTNAIMLFHIVHLNARFVPTPVNVEKQNFGSVFFFELSLRETTFKIIVFFKL